METATRRASVNASRAGDLPSARRSILKKESFIDVHDDLERAMASSTGETPEQWFQRILASHKLSPLDLCDRFCFGDARKHRHVALKHVCEVLFELEEPGCDPMSDAMEEFLYGFSVDGGDGEIVVDIQDALRTLDIWKTTGPSTGSPSTKGNQSLGSPMKTVSPAKAAILEVKAEKLKKVIDNLQQENLRLSRALSTSSSRRGDSSSNEEVRPPSPLRIAVKKPVQEATTSSLSSSSTQRPASPSKQPQAATVVSRHERELISLANRLEYTGVKRLEELLRNDDKSGAGFVNLKQLRWLLVNECRVAEELSESRLMELSLGMNFNAQGQLDYNEFVRVLLDILVYESRPSQRASTRGDHSTCSSRLNLSEADEALLTKTREYLHGFEGSHEKIRERLDTLCDKYDLEGNQCLSLTELTRAFQVDVAGHHPVRLKFPLTQSETRKLLLCLAETSSRPVVEKAQVEEDKDAVFVYYPGILDALFHADTKHSLTAPASAMQALLARVLTPEFWVSLRSALCPQDGHASLERKIHTQLCKILMKLDPKQRFQIALRHFVRVFDQHWSARDLDVLAEILSHPLDNRVAPNDARWVRYDLLMRLLFGAPELRDASALASIVEKLRHSSASWRDELTGLVHTHHTRDHHAKKLSYQQTYALLCGREDEPPLNITEFLYLAAHAQDDTHHGGHCVDGNKLWMLLSAESTNPRGNTKESDPRNAGEQSFGFLCRCLRVLYDEHGLDKAIARLCHHERGIVRVDDLANELCGQLRVLKLTPAEREQLGVDQITAFLDYIAGSGEDTTANSPGGDLLYTHALADAVFDWEAVTLALRLPDRLVDVKKTLELFDWERNGSIDVDDWAKAWRQLTVRSHSEKNVPSIPPLHDWEMRVLVRRFPAGPSEKRSRRSAQGLGAIDYSRLLVFLLERQQRVARDQLQSAVVMLLKQTCDRVTQGKLHVTTFHLEQAFEAIDREGKGYFHVGDLRAFVMAELDKAEAAGMDVQTLQAYASQEAVLDAVMAFLAGDKDAHKLTRHGTKKVVSLMRFQELMNHGFFQAKPRGHPSRSKSRSHRSTRSHEEEEDDTSSAEEEAGEFESDSHTRGHQSVRVEGQITLLRDLEVCIFEICKPFVDAHGQISPTTAYAHLNGSTGTAPAKQHRRPRSQSPVRTSRPPSVSLSASYSSSSSRRASSMTPRSIAEGNAHDPLTASRLKQTLRSLHRVETSTHLIGQFFLRLGSTTKHFLELALFAKWIAPLPMELQSRVKQIVREMLVKSKSGGGHVDLERFIGHIERRLVDAQMTEDAMVGHASARHTRAEDFYVRTVRPAVLLTRLHQLSVSIRKSEMGQLLRHFGMEDQYEIDFGVFLRRLYELSQQLPVQ